MVKMYMDLSWLKERVKERVKGAKVKGGVRVSMAIQELSTPFPILYDNRTMPAASLIKLPIMATAFKLYDEGKFDLTAKVKVHDAVEGGSFFYLPKDTEVTWQEAVFHMIVESDNTCANMLIDEIGMDRINEEIKRIGLHFTLLQRKMMDFDAIEQQKENWTSQNDMAVMLYLLSQKQWLGPKLDTQMKYILGCQEDNCILPAQLPNYVHVAHKTGELDGIYHDCGIIEKDGSPYICCIMTDGITNQAQTISDLSYLARDIYDVM